MQVPEPVTVSKYFSKAFSTLLTLAIYASYVQGQLLYLVDKDRYWLRLAQICFLHHIHIKPSTEDPHIEDLRIIIYLCMYVVFLPFHKLPSDQEETF